jgi:hypothetical protein
LSDAEWELIGPLLPPERGRWARPAGDNRRFLNGMLHVLRVGCPWRETAPERVGVTDRCDQRRRVERPDTGDGQQPSGAIIGTCVFDELGVETGDPPVERLPVLTHVSDEYAVARSQDLLLGVEQFVQSDCQLRAALGHDVSAFEKQAPDLVHQRGAFVHEPITNAVQRLHVELLLAKRMVGLVAASAIASASRSSFFCALT